MNNELKKCPFCGGNASLVVVTHHIENNLIVVKCDLCGASTKVFGDRYSEKAYAAWNTRRKE